MRSHRTITFVVSLVALKRDMMENNNKPLEPIFILAGQSNMAGRCNEDQLPEEFKPAKSGLDFQICWDLDKNFGKGCSSGGEFLPLQPQESPGLNMNIFGPEMGLARSLTPRLKEMGVKRAYFVKFALGSTSLYTNWNPSNSVVEGNMADIGYYRDFIKFCRDAVGSLNPCGDEEYIPNRPILGLLWLQGEGDSSKAKTANSYLTNFKIFVESVRNDLQCPDLPVIVSPVVWQRKKVHVVNSALRAAPSKVPNCFCIEGLQKDRFGLQGDDAGVCAGHLTAEGLCEIGLRMGEAVPLDDQSRKCEENVDQKVKQIIKNHHSF
jgi:Carbohydrate esterase, sialic acid-specific acetylesterase